MAEPALRQRELGFAKHQSSSLKVRGKIQVQTRDYLRKGTT